MHKILTKTLFLGKKVIYLPSCHSTNDIALRLLSETSPLEGTMVVTDHQTKGRGQRGNSWASEPGTNITFSIILLPRFLDAMQQFYLNIACSLAVYDLLKAIIPSGDTSEAAVKWPNDLYVNDNKIGGILIENTIKKNAISTAVVGIGLNVNQKSFGFQGPTSIYQVTGAMQELPKMLEQLVGCLEKRYIQLRNGAFEALSSEYHSVLYWKDEAHLFKAETYFEGKIRGIDNAGRLVIETESELRTFGVKDVQFIE